MSRKEENEGHHSPSLTLTATHDTLRIPANEVHRLVNETRRWLLSLQGMSV